jgi:glycosyltransferase involved in cell wall biosynthesis
MRLGFDLSPLAGFGSLGVRRACSGLYEALRARGRFEWVPLEPPPGLGSLRWRQWELPRRAERAGLRGLHNTLSALPLLGRMPLLQTVYELPWRRGEREGADLVHRAWVHVGARRAAAVLVPSPATQADWSAELPRARRGPQLVPFGGAERLPRIEPERARAEVHGLLCVERPYLLALGATRRKKRLPELVAALGAAPAARGLALLVSGARSEGLAQAEALAERAGLELIAIDGRLGRPAREPELAALLAGARALLSAAKSEGFGFPVLEALAQGTPALVQARSGPELSFPAARSIDFADPAALSAALEVALRADAAARQALIDSVRPFTWERAAAAVEALWSSVLERDRP